MVLKANKYYFEISYSILALALILWILPFTAYSGDTIFKKPPDPRYWDPKYVQTVFIDNFNGNKIDTSVWAIDLCKSRGFNGNNEGGQKNVEVSNGTLKLWARYEPANVDTNCWDNTHFVSDYTTAEIYTLWDRYKYGVFEARCLFPRGDHFYYAYWLWGPGGNGYPQDGFISEIDIAEGIEWSDGTHHEMKSVIHYWSQTDGEITLPDSWQQGHDTIYEGAWHTYKIIWNPYDVTFVFDNAMVWKRTKYYTSVDLHKNDVGLAEIEPAVVYHEREYYPNDEMETVFQMHVKENVENEELPVAMQVDYVKVSQYFLSPQITCPEIITNSAKAVLDVDEQATNIKWRLESDDMFEVYEGTGKVAEIIPKPGEKGDATITYTFQMPTGEIYKSETDFLVDKATSSIMIQANTSSSGGKLKITPNPANEWIIVTAETDRKWDLEIYTAGSQLVKKAVNITADKYRVNVTSWNPGVYAVFVNDGFSRFSAKLIVR